MDGNVGTVQNHVAGIIGRETVEGQTVMFWGDWGLGTALGTQSLASSLTHILSFRLKGVRKQKTNSDKGQRTPPSSR